MSFCSNCGQKLATQIKFCPSCGTKISGVTSDLTSPQHLKEYQEKMYKNTVISLKDEGRKIIENKAKETFSSFAKHKFKTSESTQPIAEVFKPAKTFNNEVNKPVSSASKINKWTWIYIVINALLVYFGNQLEEIVGVLFFSFFILLIVFIRRKKEKPYNWLVKIILVVQLIFLIALVADRLENITVITILLMGLLITNLMLLFNGNKS
jgi:uncharacterized Zn finger protein (UPF0148 family)